MSLLFSKFFFLVHLGVLLHLLLNPSLFFQCFPHNFSGSRCRSVLVLFIVYSIILVVFIIKVFDVGVWVHHWNQIAPWLRVVLGFLPIKDYI